MANEAPRPSSEEKRPGASANDSGSVDDDPDRTIAYVPKRPAESGLIKDKGKEKDVDPDSFARTVVELDLIAAEELRAVRDRLPENARATADLARELVRAGFLTGYQAAAILQGKSRGLVLGNYVVLDKLGAGGGGMVFKARHRKLGRIVALKILPPSVTRDPTVVSRFRREVQVAAQFSHPNIVAAHDADEFQGLHFLVMEQVDGRDLASLVRSEGPLTEEKAVDLIIQAARGLRVAHQGGIIHRDIKPSNLMLDRDGTVKVLDMGLARIADPADGSGSGPRPLEAGLTQVNSIVGTIDYMSPEQAYNSIGADERSDIYSLGCTFFYLMTGSPPFPAGTLVQRLLAHREAPIPQPPNARKALLDVLAKMLAKDPIARYQSMSEVVDALEALRAPIVEKPSAVGSTAIQRERPRQIRRIGLGIAAIALAAVAFGVWRIWPKSGNARELAVAPKAARPIDVAPPKIDSIDSKSKSAPSVAAAPPKIEPKVEPEPKQEIPEEIGVSALLRGHEPGRAESAAISGDGRLAATAGSDGTVRVWELKTRNEIFKGTHVGPAVGVAFSSDGKQVVSIGEDDRIRIWDPYAKRPIRDFSTGDAHPREVKVGRRGAVSPGFTGGLDKTVRLWDLDAGREIGRFEHSAAGVNGVAFLPESLHSALSAGNDRTIRLWDLNDGRETRRIEAGFRVLCLAVSPEGRRLLAGGRDGALIARELGGQENTRLDGHRNFVMCVDFISEDIGVSGDMSGALILWDLKTARELWRSPVETPGHRAIAVSPDGRRILTADEDGIVRLWNLPVPKASARSER